MNVYIHMDMHLCTYMIVHIDTLTHNTYTHLNIHTRSYSLSQLAVFCVHMHVEAKGKPGIIPWLLSTLFIETVG